MDNFFNIGVFKKSEDTEYYGRVHIIAAPNGYNCKYNLVSQKNKNNIFVGEFFTHSDKLAALINYLDSRINTFSESQKTQ